MEFLNTLIKGCFELVPSVSKDLRGRFVKLFNREEFARLGLAVDFKEQFYSVSRKGVLRGLHFQLPPHDQAKLVSCLDGKVFDVAVDLRTGSETMGSHVSLELSAERANSIYLPSGVAHGFYTLSESATLLYSTTSSYSPEHDAGIRWDSADIDWPAQNPILSSRDEAFPRLVDFRSPFTV
jgi:dTDP-4-dehydrorhamnose 3,5-epimerase